MTEWIVEQRTCFCKQKHGTHFCEFRHSWGHATRPDSRLKPVGQGHGSANRSKTTAPTSAAWTVVPGGELTVGGLIWRFVVDTMPSEVMHGIP